MTSEKTKMLAGELYDPADPELRQDRARARDLCRALNQATDRETIRSLAWQLIGREAPGLSITPPFHCDYGLNIEPEDEVYFNVNCVLLDTCRIRIGRHTLFGPGVQIYTVNHPMDAALRRTGLEIGQPVTIGRDVWVGGGSVICPGVEIGDGTVIGAGSVVSRSLPAGVLAVGNPCRVVREIG